MRRGRAYEGSTTSSQKRCVQSRSSVPAEDGPLGVVLSMFEMSCHRESRSMRDSRRSSVDGAARSGGAAPALRLLGEFFFGDEGS
jgi:hypothetical protein